MSFPHDISNAPQSEREWCKEIEKAVREERAAVVQWLMMKAAGMNRPERDYVQTYAARIGRGDHRK